MSATGRDEEMDSGGSSPVRLSSKLTGTELPEAPPAWQSELAQAAAQPGRSAVAAVVAAHPTYLAAWVELARRARDALEAYAYFRVAYHRGLDALRGAGWTGSGWVRRSAPGNRAFLDALEGLATAAEMLGETTEVERCRRFLHQLDPDAYPSVAGAEATGSSPEPSGEG
jgi:hypothetical protein